jgi:hypothetical protein
MRPNFALILSSEGISLLHRTHAGWHLVGEVALDNADFSADLAELTRKARALDPTGLRSKLVIPADHIKYLGVETGASDGQQIEREVRQALDGATPYALNELSYDWSMRGGHVHIAAVAQETLVEAETFALEHDFNPLCFVAMPEQSAFAGEPYFGETKHAVKTLGPDETIAREDEVIRIVGAAQLPEPETVTAAEAPRPAADTAPEPAPAPADIAPPAGEPPPAGDGNGRPEHKQEAGQKPKPATPETDAQALPGSGPGQGEKPDGGAAPPAAPQEAESPRGGRAKAGAGAFSSIRAASGGNESAEAPRADLPRARFSAPPTAPGEAAGIPKAPDDADLSAGDLPGKTPPGKTGDPAAEPVSAPQPARGAPAAPRPATSAAKTGRKGAGRTGARKALAALLPRRTRKPAAAQDGAARPSKPARTPPPEAKPAAADTLTAPMTADMARDERERLTIFGARRAATEDPGRPRYVALMLTALLLLVLVAVAAWAALTLGGGLSRAFGPDDDAQVTQAPAPGADDAAASGEAGRAPATDTGPDTPPEATADGAESAEDAAVAALVDEDSPEPDPSAQGQGAADAPAAGETVVRPEIIPEELTPDQARRRYAATGIWQKAPEPSAAPGPTERREVYRTAPDPAVSLGSRTALPGPDTYSYAAHPPRPGLPPPPLTRFELDERGFIAATPEGTETPDGVVIYAGSPPLEPPPTPPRAAPQVLEDPTAAAPEEPALRPRPRPEDLTSLAEPETPGTPEQRRETAAAPDDSATQDDAGDPRAGGTEAAVDVSLLPRARPGGFTDTVEDTRAAARDPVSPDQRFAAATPSAARVARAATEDSRISLRDLNLIGVYGTPDDRRALVRLANGSYRKVQVGDRLDGGRIAAIGADQLRYVKRGQAQVLRMPDG